MREEKDSIGKKALDDTCLYGIQTARAAENFPLGEERTNLTLIYAMVKVKKAAVSAYRRLNAMEPKKADAILAACDEILSGSLDAWFVTHPLQGGAGTSAHMNVNEVIANAALAHLGLAPGHYEVIHPLDDVNRGQSTNDVYPTALRIAAIEGVRALSQEAARLQESLQRRENEFESILKLGRTELMDALPITLGQEFGAYAQAIGRDRWRIYKAEERLRQVNLGGTAVGTGSNADRKYTYLVIEELRKLTGMGLARAEYPMDLTQNNDVFAEVSGLLKALAVNLMKISNDLRLMNSGPKGGFGEITLERRQSGSTIMPGKVNPVIPEMVTQAAIQVMANDTAITIAAASGQLELNAFLPLIADNLLKSLSLLTRTCKILREACIDTLTANPARCRELLDSTPVLITALSPHIGYDLASELYSACQGDPTKIREQVLERGLLDADRLDALLSYRHAGTYTVE